jgi:hypothetical protein
MLCAGARVIVNVPDWLAQPEVCAVSVNVPEPEVIPIAMLPCMVMVLRAMPPGGVPDMFIVSGPPFTAEPRLPLRVVPMPKHIEMLSTPLKFTLLARSVMSFWVRLKVNVSGCCPAEVDKTADHEPLADAGCGLPPQATREMVRANAEATTRHRIIGPSLAALDEGFSCRDVQSSLK